MKDKIAILTYPVRHRKTYDMVCLLKASGYDDVMVCAIPFHYEKKKFPIYKHRPDMTMCAPDMDKVCENLGYRYLTGPLESFEIEKDRLVLISGARILSEEFIKEHTIINAHPGYIPDCRGLDAYKWAIVEDKPIGVTSHYIGDYVDAGSVIERRGLDISMSDTFHSMALKVYENEVSMLIEAIEKRKTASIQVIEPGNTVLHKRMPPEIEQNLLEAFEVYKKKHATDITREI